MKFTNEMLMQAMGLAVGDRVKIKTETKNHDYKVMEGVQIPYLQAMDSKSNPIIPIVCLIDQEIEILPKTKKIGELKCEEFNNCNDCPLQFICNLYNCPFGEENSLYNILTEIDVYDQEIHDLLKARLDKEVVEE